ncbi:class 3 adenylate cyclase [Phyllobacterium sp. 1468]|uniref:adenylate/guanylate cyclase domain-containing protein n=1 Tax=Phyllobacterium sp. 1468 TaxID=2817759 RepID=UPI00285E00F6|nr:adenylate/guanylate cyclase domain-containing protein [Phyllobacterium sp. 1468]MDR6635939.1 class 3 adenylate cyclase [Phyllobacterium sp. 1468]
MITMEAPPLERKLVAILAADVEGYSRLMHQDEEAALATLSSHRSIIDSIIVQGRGEISGTAGDSVLAEFASVVDAVHSAVLIQQALTKANATLSPDRRMMLRIGINVGDVMVKDNGIFGDGVNVAARLEAMAEPGSICVTRGVRDHLRDRVDYEFEDLGEHTVKNIARPVRVFRVKFDRNATSPLPVSEPADGRSTIQLTDIDATSEGRNADPIELEFWKSVETSGNHDEYRAYLKQYPDGNFAALAKARLAKPASAKPDVTADREVELEFWTSIKDGDVAASFEAYLEKYPEGEFKALAKIRLGELSESQNLQDDK